jgi:hypothetical protein
MRSNVVLGYCWPTFGFLSPPVRLPPSALSLTFYGLQGLSTTTRFSSLLPLNPQLSAAHQRPAITNQIWLRKAITFHAAEPDWAGQIGARLGPDWG